jgi:Zn-dependent M28 family amino/carboxypeptidase
MRRAVSTVCVLLVAWALVPPPARPADAAATPALAYINGQRLLQHIRVLSSDAFEGRAPASHGEDVTVAYLIRQFRELGLEPGNPDGSYVQTVPMTAFTTRPGVALRIGAETLTLKVPDEYVGWSSERRRHFVIHNSPLVFVGYGVKAPEYGWDDYKGIDLRGKTIVMLINDPPIPDPDRPDRLDPKMFGGKAMTYYGRWTYKYEIAAKLGAAAAIIVHETGPAAYPYSVVRSSWGGENFSLRFKGRNPDFPAVAGWMTDVRARELFARCGLDFDALKARALRRDFRPVALEASVTLDIHNAWRDVQTRNVVAKIAGSDPARAHEVVIYSAHWDHFGWNRQLPGPKTQQIFHGALDNASGTAALLTLAGAFRTLPQSAPRSLLFIATTGEERGLLGAAYYARHPLYPLRDTVADLNMDGINAFGRTRDLEIIGYGKSDLDDLATAVAASQGRVTVPDMHPERGHLYRADQFEFARVGVPVLYAEAGGDFIGQPAGYGEAKTDAFIEHDYHQVSDVIRPDWTMDGGAEDVQLLWQVGRGLANSERFPEWKNGSEFKAVRDAKRPVH